MAARAVMIGLAGVAYVVATHWLMTEAPASDWNAVWVVGPMIATAAVVAWQRRLRTLAVLATAVCAGLVFQAWHGGGLAPQTLYVAQHVAVHLLLALVFAATLQAGRESLITALARRVHGGLTADMAAYSRKVTVAWTLYFLVMAALSLVLFAFAPFAVRAVFANIATPLAMAALFVGEYVLRYRLHPEFERATLSQAMTAYSQRSQPIAVPVPPHE